MQDGKYEFFGKDVNMREEQQKNRDRVTRRSGTKMYGNATARKAPNAFTRLMMIDNKHTMHRAPKAAPRTRASALMSATTVTIATIAAIAMSVSGLTSAILALATVTASRAHAARQSRATAVAIRVKAAQSASGTRQSLAP